MRGKGGVMAAESIMAVAGLILGLGALAWFFVSTGRAVRRFDRLDSSTRRKVLLLEYYMAAVRNLSREELTLLGTLPDEEIAWLNGVRDYYERLRAIRKKIRRVSIMREGFMKDTEDDESA
jgi:hypothetical protein